MNIFHISAVLHLKKSFDYFSIEFTQQNEIVLSMFSRKLKNLLSSNRLIRQIHRDGNAKVARTEKLSLSQSLKNRLMAPAGPTGMYLNKTRNHFFFQYFNKLNEFDFSVYYWTESINRRINIWFRLLMLLWSRHEKRYIDSE